MEFRGLASPFGVASYCLHHCCARVAQSIRTIQTYRGPRLPPTFAGSPHNVLSHVKTPVSNYKCGSRSLSDLTEHLTARAVDGHAIPLGSLGKPFGLTFILPSVLVRFSALSWIKPHAALLVCSPANSFKFQPCDRNSQVASLTSSPRYRVFSKNTQHLARSVYS